MFQVYLCDRSAYLQQTGKVLSYEKYDITVKPVQKEEKPILKTLKMMNEIKNLEWGDA